jgi:DNA repair exonuclease SbcCD nuclease subunit
MTKKKPIALVAGDMHFRDAMPRCRHEPDWYEYQKNIMTWLSDQCSAHNVDLIIAGDVFERLKQSNNIVNMAIDNLPKTHCIVGNHDILPGHNLDLVKKSAYGSFIRSKTGNQIEKGFKIGDIEFHPFNFSEELTPCPENDSKINIAIIHEFVWHSSEPFPGASPKGEVNELVKRLSGYDGIIAGDHHHFFETRVDDTDILNCGSLYRIHASQIDYQPMVHLMFDDGSFDHIEVPCVDDKITREHLDGKKNVAKRIDSFVNNLQPEQQEKTKISFEERVRRSIVVNEIESEVVEIIEENMI